MRSRVHPGIKEGTRVEAVTVDKLQILLTSPYTQTPSTTSITGNVIGRHETALKQHGDKVGLWKLPTSYAVFACLVSGGPFAYTYRTVGFPAYSMRRTSDNTDRKGVYGPQQGLEYTGTKLNFGVHVPDVSPNLKAMVVARALAQLQDKRVDLVATLGEAKQTVVQIAETVSRLARFFRAIKRGNAKSAIHALFSAKEANRYIHGLVERQARTQVFSTFANKFRYNVNEDPRKVFGRNGRGKSEAAKLRLWQRTLHVAEGRLRYLKPHDLYLELKFGVLPMIQDLNGFFSILQDEFSKPGMVIVGMSRAEQSYATPSNALGLPLWDVSGKITVGAECKLYAKLDSSYSQMLAATGLNDFASSAWELVPYSFVIDWLIPIGNVLQALSAHSGITFLSGFTNTRMSSDFTVTCCHDNGFTAYGTGKFPNVRYRAEAQLRERLFDLPLPLIYVRSPFSGSHITSAIALVAQLGPR